MYFQGLDLKRYSALIHSLKAHSFVLLYSSNFSSLQILFRRDSWDTAIDAAIQPTISAGIFNACKAFCS